MYILGLHTSHDTSACLLKDGQIIVAIEKERLVRHKHCWGNNDFETIVNYCLDFAGIALSDIEHIVVNDINNVFKDQVFSNREYIIGHHLAHAWATVGLSPYDECAVLILDGEGSKLIELEKIERDVCQPNEDFFAEKESCYHYKDGQLLPIRKWTSGRGGDSKFSGTDATGSPYWILSQYFFNKEHQESKIMGLASYGHDHSTFNHIYYLSDEGRVEIDKNWIYDFVSFPKNDLEANFQRYADLAASIQSGLERAIIHKAKWLKEVTGSSNLCFSGGVALNCVANSKLYHEKVFDDMFVPFGAGDSSISIGCAYYGWHVLAGQKKMVANVQSPYLGKCYQDEDIRHCLDQYCTIGLISYEIPDDYISVAASLLQRGTIIAWFQDRSEFGPRALGNRSIIANPTLPLIRDVLNRKVKFRESFRPFAPAVLEEFANDWFEYVIPSTQFMQFIANVRDDKKKVIPQVTHVDGTARIQLVNSTLNPTFYGLLTEFNRISGIPVLINTSFNIQEPIVESPVDALHTFIASSIDHLFISKYKITSNVKMVTKAEEMIGGNCYLLVHKSTQLRKNPQGKYSMQIITGMETNFRFGNYYQISNYSEIRLSDHLYDTLYSFELSCGSLFKLSPTDIRSLAECFEEVKNYILSQRIFSILTIKS